MNGLLLLSYPCIETFTISNFDKQTISLKEKDLKKYVKDNDYKINKINRYTLLNATVMMNKGLLKCGITEYDLDDFSKTSLIVFNEQELFLRSKKYYNLLSLISIMLLDLNIITIR